MGMGSESSLACSVSLYLPANYVSGSPLSGSAVYANLSYANLRIVKNKTYWTWNLDGIPGSEAKSVTIWATPERAVWRCGESVQREPLWFAPH